MDFSDTESKYSDDSNESLETYYSIFQLADQDKDGLISFKEMLQLQRYLAIQRGDIYNDLEEKEQLREYFRENHLNENQLFTYDTFVHSLLKKKPVSTAISRPVSPTRSIASSGQTDISHLDNGFYMSDITHKQAFETRSLIKNRRAHFKKYGTLTK